MIGRGISPTRSLRVWRAWGAPLLGVVATRSKTYQLDCVAERLTLGFPSTWIAQIAILVGSPLFMIARNARLLLVVFLTLFVGLIGTQGAIIHIGDDSASGQLVTAGSVGPDGANGGNMTYAFDTAIGVTLNGSR